MTSLAHLEKSISALENMSQPLRETHFGKEFFDDLLKELSIPKSPQKFVKERKPNNAILPIKILRELCQKMRKRSKLSENEVIFLNKLSQFLKQFQFAKSLKQYHDQKVYSPICIACFDPFDLILFKEEKTTETFFLTEIVPSRNLKELMEMEKRKKIIDLCEELSKLNFRWSQIMDEENIDTENMEEEVSARLKLNKGKLDILENIFFDLNLKTTKSISLLRDWLNQCNKQTIGKNNNFPERKYFQKVMDIKMATEKLNEEIKSLENVILHVKTDNRNLVEKEHQLLVSINKKEDLVEIRDSAKRSYEGALVRRSDLISELNNSIHGTSKQERISQEIFQVEEIINEKFSELKTLNQAVFRMNQDSEELCTSLKDFVRWSDTSQQILEDKEEELKKKIKEKENNEVFLERVSENLQRLKLLIGSNIGELSSVFEKSSICSGRPFTSTTYTINQDDVRFTDMNLTGTR